MLGSFVLLVLTCTGNTLLSVECRFENVPNAYSTLGIYNSLLNPIFLRCYLQLHQHQDPQQGFAWFEGGGTELAYQGRTPASGNPVWQTKEQHHDQGTRKYDDETMDIQSRQLLNQPNNWGSSLVGGGLFNSRFSLNGARPLAWLGSRMPIIWNPNYGGPLSTFDSCVSPSGEVGICTPVRVCSLLSGRPSGTCLLGGVCCINAVTTCTGTITLNNTYWQSPTTPVSLPSICSLAVRLDAQLIEQKKPVCQVRLDFASFTIAQPNDETVCVTDSFQVAGTTNQIPTICGVNSGQHMYLNIPSSATTRTDLQLMFNFGPATVSRSWSIKIAMLPCGADYLAPIDCLQYFTSTSGTIKTFNWRDVAGTATGQLANQNYRICFRTELVSGQMASILCFTPCTVTTNQLAFSVSTPVAADGTWRPGTSQNLASNCNNDYLVVAGGFNPAVQPVNANTNALDRYCGEQLNPLPAAATSVTVCTSSKPFGIWYRTNNDETATSTTDAPSNSVTNGNRGFCLSFQQRTS